MQEVSTVAQFDPHMPTLVLLSTPLLFLSVPTVQLPCLQHLIAWAQIGVLIRVYFAELFSGACTIVPWAPCLTSSGNRYGGAFFTDIVSNIVGSFLMGLFVSSDVLSNCLKHILSVEAPMAMLPVKSPLQEHVAFQVGA